MIIAIIPEWHLTSDPLPIPQGTTLIVYRNGLSFEAFHGGTCWTNGDTHPTHWALWPECLPIGDPMSQARIDLLAMIQPPEKK